MPSLTHTPIKMSQFESGVSSRGGESSQTGVSSLSQIDAGTSTTIEQWLAGANCEEAFQFWKDLRTRAVIPLAARMAFIADVMTMWDLMKLSSGSMGIALLRNGEAVDTEIPPNNDLVMNIFPLFASVGCDIRDKHATSLDIVEAKTNIVNSFIQPFARFHQFATTYKEINGCMHFTTAFYHVARNMIDIIYSQCELATHQHFLRSRGSRGMQLPFNAHPFPEPSAYFPSFNVVDQMLAIIIEKFRELQLCHDEDRVYKMVGIRHREVYKIIPYAEYFERMINVVKMIISNDARLTALLNQKPGTVINHLAMILTNMTNNESFPTYKILRCVWVISGPNYFDYKKWEDDGKNPDKKPPNEVVFFIARAPLQSDKPGKFTVATIDTIDAEIKVLVDDELDMHLDASQPSSDVADVWKKQCLEGKFFSAVNFIGFKPYKPIEKKSEDPVFTFRPGELESIIDKTADIEIPDSASMWNRRIGEIVTRPITHSPYFTHLRSILKSQAFLPGRNDDFKYCSIHFVLIALLFGQGMFPLGSDKIPRFLAFVGASGTGKTGMMQTYIQKLYGNKVYSLLPEGFNKFQINELVANLVAFVDDMPAKDKTKNETIFNPTFVQKWLTGAGFPLESKNVQEVKMEVINLRLMLTAQVSLLEAFGITGNLDKELALLRRFIEIHFGNVIANRDNSLTDLIFQFIMPLMALGHDFYHLLCFMTRKGTSKCVSELPDCAWFNRDLKARVNPTTSVSDDSPIRILFEHVLQKSNPMDCLTTLEIYKGDSKLGNKGFKGFTKKRNKEAMQSLWNAIAQGVMSGDEEFFDIRLDPTPQEVQLDATVCSVEERKVYGFILKTRNAEHPKPTEEYH